MARELKLRNKILRSDIRPIREVLGALSVELWRIGPSTLEDGIELLFYKDHATGITVQITKEEV